MTSSASRCRQSFALHPLRLRARRLHLLVGVALSACASMPKGTPGADADALARRIEAAIDKEAWDRTGAVQWTFAGSNHHLWDKKRDWVQVRWGDCEVRRHLWSDTGKVWCDGAEVLDPHDRREAMEDAYAKWVNDSFWLNPLVKLFDEGVTRSLVEHEDGPALLITYSSGGLTPGDSYLWVLGPDDLPMYWRMWVSVIPIPGMRASWEGWVTLSTGAKVATVHSAGLTLEMTNVAGAASVEELVGNDPFQELAGPSKPAPE